MATDDSHDPSPTPRINRAKWLLAVGSAVILAGLLVFVRDSSTSKAWGPDPEVLGKASWKGEVTSDVQRAVLVLDSALADANRVVLTARKGLLFHVTDDTFQRKTSGPLTFPPLRVFELNQKPLSFEPHLKRQIIVEGFLYVMRNYPAVGFDPVNETDYDMILHFYHDDELLAVVGWSNGAAVVRGWTDEPPQNYLRWLDGGWQGDLALSGEAASRLFAWLLGYGVRTVSEGWWSIG